MINTVNIKQKIINPFVNFLICLKDVVIEIGKYDLEKGIKWDEYL